MDDNARFAEITTDYLADLYQRQPVMATGMGVHEYDDRLPNLSGYAIADELRRARAYLHDLDKLSLVDMVPDNRVDYRLARAETQMTITNLEQVRPYERNPGAYLDTALYGVFLLMVRDFADAETRAHAMVGRLRAVPELLRQARENLQNPPRIFTEIAIQSAEGGESFFAQNVPAFADPLRNEDLRADVTHAAQQAAAALHEFTKFLKNDLLPRSEGDFALGKELFDYTLRMSHFMDETSDDLLAIGREALEDTKAALARTAAEIDPSRHWTEIVAELKRDHPAANELVRSYASEMERARDFVVAQELVDLPHHESLNVIETPPFQRNMLPYAAYMPPAPFEARQDGLFWVTPIDTAQSPDRREAQLQGHSRYNIVIIALHEAYPGHHLQMSRANQIESRFRRHFANSNLFLEGWALYCEEMMYEAGFYHDPRVRLMQLKDQLWRAARVVIDVQLHTAGMTPEEAVRFLVEEAKLEEPNAQAEVRRYTLTPTQPMSYILGKRAILALRDQVRRRQGDRFNLRRFHNDLLSHGSLPPRLVRESMGIG